MLSKQQLQLLLLLLLLTVGIHSFFKIFLLSCAPSIISIQKLDQKQQQQQQHFNPPNDNIPPSPQIIVVSGPGIECGAKEVINGSIAVTLGSMFTEHQYPYPSWGDGHGEESTGIDGVSLCSSFFIDVRVTPSPSPNPPTQPPTPPSPPTPPNDVRGQFYWIHSEANHSAMRFAPLVVRNASQTRSSPAELPNDSSFNVSLQYLTVDTSQMQELSLGYHFTKIADMVFDNDTRTIYFFAVSKKDYELWKYNFDTAHANKLHKVGGGGDNNNNVPPSKMILNKSRQMIYFRIDKRLYQCDLSSGHTTLILTSPDSVVLGQHCEDESSATLYWTQYNTMDATSTIQYLDLLDLADTGPILTDGEASIEGNATSLAFDFSRNLLIYGRTMTVGPGDLSTTFVMCERTVQPHVFWRCLPTIPEVQKPGPLMTQQAPYYMIVSSIYLGEAPQPPPPPPPQPTSSASSSSGSSSSGDLSDISSSSSSSSSSDRDHHRSDQDESSTSYNNNNNSSSGSGGGGGHIIPPKKGDGTVIALVFLIILITMVAICAMCIIIGATFGNRCMRAMRRKRHLNNPKNLIKSMIINATDSAGSASLTVEFYPRDFVLIRKLGSGGFGICYLAKYKGYDYVAVKKIKISEALACAAEETINGSRYADTTFAEEGKQVVEEFRREALILTQIRHKNIINFYGWCLSYPELWLVTEYMPKGSLFDVINKTNEVLSWETKLSITNDIVRAMCYLHDQGYIHRDLKSQNVLLDDYYTAKVCDFGLAKVLHDDRNTNNMTAVVGSSLWMAPEVALGKDYGAPCDVYSFGIIMWEILCMKKPYHDLEDHRQIHVKVALDPAFRPTLPVIPKPSEVTSCSDNNNNNNKEQLEDESDVIIGDSHADENVARPLLAENTSSSSSSSERAPSSKQQQQQEQERRWQQRIKEYHQQQKYIELMKECWSHDEAKRPTFVQISNRLQQIVKNNSRNNSSNKVSSAGNELNNTNTNTNTSSRYGT